MTDPLFDTDERRAVRLRHREFWHRALRANAPGADAALVAVLALLRAEVADRRLHRALAETLLDAKFEARLLGADDAVALEYDALIACLTGSDIR